MALFTNEPERSSPPEHLPSLPVSSSMPVVERVAEQRTHLDQAARVSGKLNFESATRIDGQVDGEIVATDLTIGETAVVKARITAASIIVNGTTTGEIAAKRRVEIRPTAKVTGNITAPILVVHEGARFDGNCTTGSQGKADDCEATLKEHSGETRIVDHQEV